MLIVIHYLLTVNINILEFLKYDNICNEYQVCLVWRSLQYPYFYSSARGCEQWAAGQPAGHPTTIFTAAGKYSERWFTILNDFSLPVTPKLSTMEGVFQRLVPSLLPLKFQRPSRRLLQLASTRKPHILQSCMQQLKYGYRLECYNPWVRVNRHNVRHYTNIWRNKIKLR